MARIKKFEACFFKARLLFFLPQSAHGRPLFQWKLFCCLDFLFLLARPRVSARRPPQLSVFGRKGTWCPRPVRVEDFLFLPRIITREYSREVKARNTKTQLLSVLPWPFALRAAGPFRVAFRLSPWFEARGIRRGNTLTREKCVVQIEDERDFVSFRFAFVSHFFSRSPKNRKIFRLSSNN